MVAAAGVERDQHSQGPAGRGEQSARFPTGVLTFLLTDVEGSTPLWERHGAVMGAALARHELLVAEAVTSHGGQLIKTRGEGDSTLSVFGWASDAAAAAIELQQRLTAERWPDGIALPTRTALHTGEAESRDDDYYGQTLNRAARLRALGRGGQVLLSRATAELVTDQLPAGVGLTDVGAHRLRGLTRPEHVFALVHPDLTTPPPAVAQRADHPHRTAFVGRDAEQAELHAALDSALGGQGQLVLIAGEPGIGKSRLARELSDEVQADGGQILWGRCWEEDGAPSFWPWMQVIRAWMVARSVEELRAGFAGDAVLIGQVLPELAERLPGVSDPPRLEPALARFRMFEAITNWLQRAAVARPTVVVLDDLHRADTPSLLLLRFLVRELANTRLLVLGTYRDTEPPDQPFVKILADLLRESTARRIRLEGLDHAEVGLFVELTTGKPAPPTVLGRIVERTSGNPFFLRELVQLLRDKGRLHHADDTIDPVEDVPLGVLDVIRGRVGELSDAAANVLAAASVLGRDFDFTTLSLVCDTDGDRLVGLVEEALAAGLVLEVPDRLGRYRFSHILVREAVYGQLRGSRRARLHQHVGEALESVYGSATGVHLAELAHHFLHASPPTAVDAGVAYAIRAGEHALRVLAYEDAASLFQAALRQPIDAARRCELLLSLADAQMKAGATVAGRATFLEAAQASETLGAPEPFARAALGFGTSFELVLADRAVVQRFIGLVEAALRRLDPADSPLRAMLLSRLAMALYFAAPERQQEALVRRGRLSAEALAMARRLGDDSVLAPVLYARCFATLGPDNLVERTALTTELIGLAEALGAQELTLVARRWQLVSCLEIGDVVGAERELLQYMRQADELRQPAYLYWAAILRSNLALLHGEFDEAERLSFEALAIRQRLGGIGAGEMDNGVAAQIHAIRREQGRLAELEPIAAALVEQLPEVPGWRMSLALIHVSTGQVPAARVHFDVLAKDGFTHLPRDGVWLAIMAGLTEVCSALGDTARAEQLYDLLLPFRQRFVIISFGFACLGSVANFLGELATVRSRWEEAGRHFDAALEMETQMGARPALARTALQYARMLLAQDRSDDRRRAHKLLAMAAETAGELGMSWLREEALAASRGGRLRRSAVDAADAAGD
jgi:class 3 adenylate cyclase/tetratricopeptide (TPR) repeat protein